MENDGDGLQRFQRSTKRSTNGTVNSTGTDPSMTINQEPTPVVPSALLSRMAWVSHAMGAGRRLLAGLQRRLRLPQTIRLHLMCLTDCGQIGAGSLVSSLDLAWYQPVPKIQTTTPIEVYLSRQYHLLKQITSQPAATTADPGTTPRFQLALPSPAERGMAKPARRTGVLPLLSGQTVRRDGLSPRVASIEPTGSLLPPQVRTPFPHRVGVTNPAVVPPSTQPFFPHAADLSSRMNPDGRTSTTTQADSQNKRPQSVVQPVSLRFREQQTMSGSGPTASLVDRLFDQAMQQRAIPDLALRVLPQAIAPQTGNAAADFVPSTREHSHQNAPDPVPPTAPLSRSEVMLVADQVSRLLKQQARFERERRGNY